LGSLPIECGPTRSARFYARRPISQSIQPPFPPEERQPLGLLLTLRPPNLQITPQPQRCPIPRPLIFLAMPTNLWQSIHHGKQRQRQARSKETKEDHAKTPPGTPGRRPYPHPRHQKSRRIAPPKNSLNTVSFAMDHGSIRRSSPRALLPLESISRHRTRRLITAGSLLPSSLFRYNPWLALLPWGTEVT
jgi:hypothetical protein